jgi:hypothetical protein
VPLVVRQAVVHEQNRAATHTLYVSQRFSKGPPHPCAVFSYTNWFPFHPDPLLLH